MSANGIQLNSEVHLQYFHPTIGEYLQSIKDAAVSNNLSAAHQAFALLRKSLQSPMQGRTTEPATRIRQGLQDAGKALETGDLSGAAQAIGELQQNIQSMSEGQAQQQDTTASGADASSVGGSDLRVGINLNVIG